MKAYKEKKWQHEITGGCGHTILFGVNIFDYKWEDTGEKIDVEDPLYGQKYRFPVYEVLIEGQRYTFAA